MPRRMSKLSAEDDCQQHDAFGNLSNFVCAGCGHGFRFKLRHDRHAKSCTHLEQMSFAACVECGKKMDRKKLAKHILARHLPEKTLSCHFDTCKNKTFSRRDKLVEHVKSVHAKLREYRCKQCGDLFKDPTHLVTHNKIHLREAGEGSAIKESDETSNDSSESDEEGKGVKAKKVKMEAEMSDDDAFE